MMLFSGLSSRAAGERSGWARATRHATNHACGWRGNTAEHWRAMHAQFLHRHHSTPYRPPQRVAKRDTAPSGRARALNLGTDRLLDCQHRRGAAWLPRQRGCLPQQHLSSLQPAAHFKSNDGRRKRHSTCRAAPFYKLAARLIHQQITGGAERYNLDVGAILQSLHAFLNASWFYRRRCGSP